MHNLSFQEQLQIVNRFVEDMNSQATSTANRMLIESWCQQVLDLRESTSQMLAPTGADYDFFEEFVAHIDDSESTDCIIEFLRHRGCSDNRNGLLSHTYVWDGKEYTTLHYAAATGNQEIAEYIESCGIDTEIKTVKHAITPLQYAAACGKYNMAAWLLEKGADVNHTDNEGLSVLRYAVRSDDWSTVKLLIDQGADVKTEDKHGFGIFHITARTGSVPFLNALIAEAKQRLREAQTFSTLINLQTQVTKNTPLHLAAYNKREDIYNLLKDHGAKEDIKNADNVSPAAVITADNLPGDASKRKYVDGNDNNVTRNGSSKVLKS
ncbi:MAG: ankyrin repeat domain-containing protein [Bacteroidota bacterium]